MFEFGGGGRTMGAGVEIVLVTMVVVVVSGAEDNMGAATCVNGVKKYERLSI
ncbi:hypothetical protein IT399_00605 [Candidatus Nomurabacteria bacterium]|nr:hypothetical protein [Candidatus Nomurabacteria bacterium]